MMRLESAARKLLDDKFYRKVRKYCDDNEIRFKDFLEEAIEDALSEEIYPELDVKDAYSQKINTLREFILYACEINRAGKEKISDFYRWYRAFCELKKEKNVYNIIEFETDVSRDCGKIFNYYNIVRTSKRLIKGVRIKPEFKDKRITLYYLRGKSLLGMFNKVV